LTSVRSRQSIADKLTRMNMLVSGAALLLACLALMAYDLVTFRNALVQNLDAQARIIGATGVSALLFDDPESAHTTLSALAATPNVVSAAIYNIDGQFATHAGRTSCHAGPDQPDFPTTDVNGAADAGVIVARLIVFQGANSGFAHIHGSPERTAAATVHAILATPVRPLHGAPRAADRSARFRSRSRTWRASRSRSPATRTIRCAPSRRRARSRSTSSSARSTGCSPRSNGRRRP
jgi:hypothetical protein